jgi:hypothetical protein
MNYDLAKQLKEAGFYQNGDGKTLMRENADGSEGVYDEMNDRTMFLEYFNPDYVAQHPEWVVYYPLLSELIEACGEHFDCLYNRGQDWGASHFANGRNQAIGKTPEDAVARLYLALKAVADERSESSKPTL